MLIGFLEAALEVEMDDHPDPEERKKDNKRNRKGFKAIISSERDFQMRPP